MNIKKILIDEIKKNGHLNIAEFMQICQFENDGYYLKNNPIGGANDFITSPEISQMFGEILAIFIINYWENKIKYNHHDEHQLVLFESLDEIGYFLRNIRIPV